MTFSYKQKFKVHFIWNKHDVGEILELKKNLPALFRFLPHLLRFPKPKREKYNLCFNFCLILVTHLCEVVGI